VRLIDGEQRRALAVRRLRLCKDTVSQHGALLGTNGERFSSTPIDVEARIRKRRLVTCPRTDDAWIFGAETDEVWIALHRFGNLLKGLVSVASFESLTAEAAASISLPASRRAFLILAVIRSTAK
jgi:hypothetical protein